MPLLELPCYFITIYTSIKINHTSNKTTLISNIVRLTIFILLPQAYKYQVTSHLLPRLHLDNSQYYICSHDFIKPVFASTPVSELSRYSCQNYFVFSEHGGEAFRQTLRAVKPRSKAFSTRWSVRDQRYPRRAYVYTYVQRARLCGRIPQK